MNENMGFNFWPQHQSYKKLLTYAYERLFEMASWVVMGLEGKFRGFHESYEGNLCKYGMNQAVFWFKLIHPIKRC